MALLEIKNLQLEFGNPGHSVRALDGVSLSLEAGETLCLVGESGSGKSVTGLSVARLLPSPPAQYCGGEILIQGSDVLKMSARELRQVRGRQVSYIFQEPASALNPVHRVGNQIREALKLHRPEAANHDEIIRLLKTVGISAAESRIKSYPYELSGGMQQRVMIAMALASNPRILIADEPTTALDVTIQAQILELLRELKVKLGMAILLITHNLGIVAELADRAAVMYAGQIVESGPASALLGKPPHPYTQALLAAIPALNNDGARLKPIPGNVPQLGAWPGGCRFHPRCSQRRPECSLRTFDLTQANSSRWVRCPFSQAATMPAELNESPAPA